MTLFDEITENNQPTIFSFEYFMDTIIQLKKLLTGYVEYEYVLQLITELGEKLVHFYLLRMVEESYKILDKRKIELKDVFYAFYKDNSLYVIKYLDLE